ncbi:ParB N-terminal domain-containing protein [Azospirillum argentinense]|uniref:Chromosome partitioning protein ParB n=1 Tax=Azospirillum brasilense TaxID=192 RepID=A0A4D8QDT2_AZOBR|nr:ParB N-terminal domain-containing protein [Azospirillum argentinense]QCO07411.1 chromosome partitioning protein ParB [Azospirillum argentinense]
MSHEGMQSAGESFRWKNRIIGYRLMPVAEILENPKAWRLHPEAQVEALRSVLDTVGMVKPLIVNTRTGRLVDGKARLDLARRNGQEQMPVVVVDLSEEEEALVLATLDPLAALAEADQGALAALLREIEAEDIALQVMLAGLATDAGLDGIGNLDEALAALGEAAGEPPGQASPPEQGRNRIGSLSARFGVSPFTVLNAREGWWQERKRAWLSLGIKSEIGRGEDLLFNQSAQSQAVYGLKNEMRERLGREPAWEDVLDEAKRRGVSIMGQTSIFDPVMCELAYRWFCPLGGTIVDPFAGGSVRGVVASRLGRPYVGMELRAEQVAANQEQGATICTAPVPTWIEGDSRTIARACKDVHADFIFGCPPYGDLEVYSNDPADLSTLDYADFLSAYRDIIAGTVSLLKDDRFACFVIGDFRDRKGFYRNFPAHTIQAFEDAGAKLYNEAILVTQVGSLPIRVGSQFTASRKLGKTHQNVVVFCKGDPVAATKAIGEVEFGDMPAAPSGTDTAAA